MLKNQGLALKTTMTALVLMLASSIAVNANENIITSSFDGVTINAVNDIVQGELRLTGLNESGKYIKILVRKNGTQDKWYEVEEQREINQEIALVDGIGTYMVYAMIFLDEYNYLYGPSILVYNTEEYPAGNVQNLQSNITVPMPDNNYKNENINAESVNISTIAELSRNLTANKYTSREKIEAIYGWLVENISYDNEKYSNMLKKDFSGRYGAEVAFETKKGVCYDYSMLFVELCKEAGIEAKMIKGYSKNAIGYHAWNEVYDSDSGNWLILDTTIDSTAYHVTGRRDGMIVRGEDEYYKTSEN